MSFGSQTGRTRSGTKGFSSKEKKQRRKKQEYHTHRRSYEQEAGRPNPQEVKARTLLTLDRLGHQVLSTEPGGYDLEHWVRSLNSLLDDFQEKVGEERITDEFRRRREEAMKSLAVSSASGGVDSDMQKLLIEEEETKGALDEARKKAAAKLASLKEERAEREKELKAQKEKLAEMKKSNQSRGLFSRVLRTGPSTEETEAAVAKLQSDVLGLDKEIEESRWARSAGNGAAEGDPAQLEALRRLESIRARLADLQSARQSSLQLAREREAATQAISAAISSIKLDGAASEGSTLQAG